MSSQILDKRSIGFLAVPDMIEPKRMLHLSRLAEKAGFDAIWVSDHFHPWFHTGGVEYSTWVWMSVAMTEIKIPFGTAVTAPILRYHPGITAQAFATMETMFGHRIILGVGAGEAMNEVPLGFQWPKYPERRDRLIESVQIMKKLWQGEFVNFDGMYYKLKNANLYLKANIPVIMSALGPKMARVVGRYGDGLITSARTPKYLSNVIFPRVKEGAKEAGRSLDDLLKVVEIDFGYDKDYDRAIQTTRKWAATLLNETLNTDISDPREIEKLGKDKVTDAQLAEVFPIVTDEEGFIRGIEKYFNAGFDHVYVELNTFDDEAAIELFRTKVLPYFKRA